MKSSIFALVVAALILLCLVQSTFAQVWITNSLSLPAGQIATSADGTKLIAACGDSGVYTSIDSGLNWIQHSLGNAYRIASSADGNVLFEFASSGGFAVSTNSGLVWSGSGSFTGQFIVCSADGTKLLIARARPDVSIFSSVLYTSTNLGVSWITNSVPIVEWEAGAASADGNTLVAAIYGGGIYTSTNFGASWVSNSVPNKSWTGVASSADGKKMVAVAKPGGLFLSGGIFTTTNSGVTWISNAAPNLPWVSVASSADGSKLVVVASGGSIYSSTNFGQDWVSNNAPNKSWVTVVSSADGSKRFASVDSGQGNFSSTIALPSPSINIAPAGGNLMLSWFVPSTNFVLQQSYDLSGWSDMTNTPVLNFSNLQNQVVLPSSADNVFYRLKTP